MSYITQSELETAYGVNEIADAADRDADGVADAAVVTAAIGRATGVIDSHLRSRFTLPLVSTPDLVREISLALVRYYLAATNANERTKDDYKQAILWLKDIREGKMDIGLDETDTAVAPTSGGAEFEHGGGAFDEDALNEFRGHSAGWRR